MVEWKEAVKHAKQFAEFDVAAVKDKLLPVREEVQRNKLLLRLVEGKSPVVQCTPTMFQGSENARHAITVLQFCQAAEMTKALLEEVKKELKAHFKNVGVEVSETGD